jgi:hypothetical protein
MNIIPVISGIYFLFLGDELVYIGQSRDVHWRVRDHARSARMTFDKWSFVEVSEDDRLRVEENLIRRYKPRLNHTHAKAPKPPPKPKPRRTRKDLPALPREEQERRMFGVTTIADQNRASDLLAAALRGDRDAQIMHTPDLTDPSGPSHHSDASQQERS